MFEMTPENLTILAQRKGVEYWRGQPVVDDEALEEERAQYFYRRAELDNEDFMEWARARGLTGDVQTDEHEETSMPRKKMGKLPTPEQVRARFAEKRRAKA